MTDEQWRAAWVLCETAGDLDAQAQREYVRGATIDPDVEGRVIAILEELEDGQVYPALPDRRIGDTVGRYLLLERIGQGGMGEVYSAEDTELRRTVALKFLPSALETGDAAAAQVISEARLASRLNHPNIVTVYELIQTPWGLAIAMELVEGQSLRTVLKATKLSTRRVIHTGRQIASALAAAHERGIVHRDIKPENVMVREDGLGKVLDFSLAQNIRDQAAANRSVNLPVGTVRYMSPEQKGGKAATTACDIYSLAVVLEEAGRWKHPILARMRSTEPLRRPPAREVEQLLAKLEAPSHKWLLVALLVCVLLVAGAGVYWLRSAKVEPAALLEQITRFSSGNDVTAAAVSRSGKHLAYATIDGGFFLRDNFTHRVRELTGPEHLACYQLLFPSDQHLLAIGLSNERLEGWQIPLDSGAPRRLSHDVELAAVSHDGKQIAWLNGSHQVWTGSAPGAPARLLMQVPADVHVAALFWSRDDKQLWFHRLSGCPDRADHPDITVNPDFCESSDLVAVAPRASRSTVSVGPLRFSSGFFTSSGEFIFLRQDFARRAEGFNIWSLPVNSTTGQVISIPKQISHFSDAALSDLTGTPDGKQLFMVRTDSSAQTYTAEWQAKPKLALRQLRRLTLQQSTNFPHCWSADNQSVIFESNRNGRFEIFQQNRNRREPELLASSERENYYPQLTPDGKWILFMSAKNTQDAGFTDYRLMRIPANGGPIAQVPLGEPLDEFRCSVPGFGHICVLRTTHDGQQTYYELDPVTGKGRELGRTGFAIVGLGRWALSADGAHIAIPDPAHAGRFTELRLDADPSKQWQRSRQIADIETIGGMNPGPARREWLAWTGPGTRTVRQVILPPFFLDPSHFSALYFVDAHLHAHLLENDSIHGFGVFSNDGRYIATIHDDLTSNLWSYDR